MARVLIADDNPLFREVLKRHVISLLGFEVVEAGDGAEAVELARTVKPELILLDLMMPDIDGIETTRRIRALPGLGDTPIVLLSAETDRRKWAEALSAGANDFVSKPYHLQELAARLSLHLKLSELGNTLRRQNVLFARERYLAGCVQRQLLPRDLAFAGFEAAAMYQAQEQVGGDFYDAWDDGSGVYALMADISGHGASSAMLMAVCRGLFLSLRAARLSPPEIAGRLNRFLYALLDGGDLDMFVTMVLCRIDRRTPVLEAVSAGHVPAYVIADGEVLEISSNGPALGIIPEYDWSGNVVPLHAGDTLFCHTDGLTELRGPDGEFFGEDRLRDLLRTDASPQARIDGIMAAALPFCRGILHDDLAMMVLRRKDASGGRGA